MTKKICIIDDDQKVRNVLEETVYNMGFYPESYASMHSFLHAQVEKYKDGNLEDLPSLVLCDKNLGKGQKFGCSHWKEYATDTILNKIPRVMLTGEYVSPWCEGCDPKAKESVTACYNKAFIINAGRLENIIKNYMRK